MREYKLSQDFFAQIYKRLLIFAVPFMILAAAMGLWIGGSWIAREEDKSYFTSPIFFAVVVLVVLTLIFSFRRSWRQQKQMWSTYRLIADESSIKRTQDGLPDILIHYSDVSKVTEAPGIGLTVQTSIPSRQISVPATLEDYAEFRLELSKRFTIDATAGSRTRLAQIFTLFYGLLTLVAITITFLATNRYIVLGTGTLLFLAQLLGLVIIQRSIHTTKQVKRNSWLVLVPLIAIGVRVFYAISCR